MTKKSENEIKDMTFEQALIELEEIVKGLEMGNVKLDEALITYERGVKLRNFCQTKLDEARLRIEKITLDSKSEPTGTTPFTTE